MVLLLLIGFVAGVITAISPCVLPVLPILLASGASGRKPLRVIAGLVVELQRVHAVRDVDPRQARPAAGHAPEPRDRVPLRARGDLARAAGGADRRAPARGLLALPPEGCGGRRLLLRHDARARVRPVRRPGARDGDRGRGEQQRRAARDPAHARVRARRRGADDRDRVRRTRGGRAPPPSRPDGAARLRRGDRSRRARPRVPRRRPPCDADPRLHDVPAEQDRGQLDREARAREGARRRHGVRGQAAQDSRWLARLRPGAAAARRRRLDQLARR